MKRASYDVRESDPFAPEQTFRALPAAVSPIVGRVEAMWETMRGVVIENFPKAHGLPKDRKEYLGFVNDIYKSDAYHSLSIEGYSVTAALIDRVRRGDWDPDHRDEDRKNRSALAARGYWQAFQLVKASVAEIIKGANPGALVRTAHKDWHVELFQPRVGAGLIPAGALAGYRNDAVYLRTSRFVPPHWEAVRDAMPARFDLRERETDAGVRAVLGHWLFGYIHPYTDGNGRLARFLMNSMLASGGYPWTVIRVEDGDAYLGSLDRVSVDGDMAPFATFIAERVQWSMEQSPAKVRRAKSGQPRKTMEPMKLKNLGTDAAGQPVYEVCGIKSLRSRSRLPRTRLSANFGNRKPAQKLALPVERNLHFKSTKTLSAYAAEARVQYPGVRRVRF